MNFIKHIIEFDQLKLVWQSENDPNHSRYVVAVLLRQSNDVQLKYLEKTPDFKKALELGFTGYPAFSLEREIHASGVLEAFQRRLPPRTRSDFDKYLEMFRLPQGAEISDFALLGYSGAKLPGDEFSLIPSFEDVEQECELLMEVAGFRHETQVPIDKIQLNSIVNFEREDTNQYDKNAVKILLNGNKIGYVTRSLLSQFNRWLDEGRIIGAKIERKNGQPEKPIIYVFVELKERHAAVAIKPRLN